MIGSYWHIQVFNTKPYMDIEKTADVTKQENYDFDASSKEWEQFENEKLQFWLQTPLREFGYKCIENKHELCKGCKCLCHLEIQVD